MLLWNLKTLLVFKMHFRFEALFLFWGERFDLICSICFVFFLLDLIFIGLPNYSVPY